MVFGDVFATDGGGIRGFEDYREEDDEYDDEAEGEEALTYQIIGLGRDTAQVFVRCLTHFGASPLAG